MELADGWGTMFPSLAQCASTRSRWSIFGVALVQTCADGADHMPWLVVVRWHDGEEYRWITHFEANGVMAYAQKKR